MDHSCKCKHAVFIKGNKHCGVLIGILKSVISVELADTQSVSVGDHTSQLPLYFLTLLFLAYTSQVFEKVMRLEGENVGFS